jgi:hypothetical protein
MAATAEDLYNIKLLRNEILAQIMQCKPKDVEIEPGQYGILVDTISPETEGVHQVDDAADYFDMNLEEELKDRSDEEKEGIEQWSDYEFAWEAVDEVAEKIAGEINKKINLPGTLSFGNTDMGDYGLMYYWEKGDHPEFDAQE